MADVCKVGDTVYRLFKTGIMETKVIGIEHYPHAIYKLEGCADSYFESAFGKTLFLTMEEANKAIIAKENVAKKRKMLKEYETELNEKFGLGDHRIVK